MRKCLPELGEEACPYCTAHPSRADPSVWNDLPSRKDGGLFFSPVPSSHPDHYETFLEMKARKRTGRLDKIVPDDCFKDLEFGRCDQEDCFYVYRSAIDRVRHLMLCHKATRKETNFDGSFICKFKLPNGETCGFKGKTQHYLNRHKDDENHKIRVHKKKTNQPETPKERKKAQKQAKKKAKKQVRKKKKPNEFLDNLISEDEEQGEGEQPDEPKKVVAQKKQAKTSKKKPANTLEEMENILQEEEEEESDYSDELGEEEQLGSSDEEIGEEDFVEEDL